MAVSERDFIKLKQLMFDPRWYSAVIRVDPQMSELDSQLSPEQRDKLNRYKDYVEQLKRLDYFGDVQEFNRIMDIYIQSNGNNNNLTILKEYYNDDYKTPIDKTRQPLTQREFMYIKLQAADDPEQAIKELEQRITPEQHEKLKQYRDYIIHFDKTEKRKEENRLIKLFYQGTDAEVSHEYQNNIPLSVPYRQREQPTRVNEPRQNEIIKPVEKPPTPVLPSRPRITPSEIPNKPPTPEKPLTSPIPPPAVKKEIKVDPAPQIIPKAQEQDTIVFDFEDEIPYTPPYATKKQAGRPKKTDNK